VGIHSQSERPIAIIAGGGSVPLHVANAARSAGRDVLVVGIEGEADPRIADFPHDWFHFGQIGRLQKILADHGTRDIVFVGSVHARPDFSRLKLDFWTLRKLPEILSIVSKGDDSVLTGVIKLFEAQGYSIIGAHEVAADLVSEPGVVAGRKPDSQGLKDVSLAIAAARRIGDLDAGQAAVSVNSRIVALEAAEGTDEMLTRVADLRHNGRVRWNGRAGVLAKCAKPHQDLRVDMPTIGPETVTRVDAAGLAGIAIESRQVMIVDRVEAPSEFCRRVYSRRRPRGR
jgi:DUF1009 family protein